MFWNKVIQYGLVLLIVMGITAFRNVKYLIEHERQQAYVYGTLLIIFPSFILLHQLGYAALFQKYITSFGTRSFQIDTSIDLEEDSQISTGSSKKTAKAIRKHKKIKQKIAQTTQKRVIQQEISKPLLSGDGKSNDQTQLNCGIQQGKQLFPTFVGNFEVPSIPQSDFGFSESEPSISVFKSKTPNEELQFDDDGRFMHLNGVIGIIRRVPDLVLAEYDEYVVNNRKKRRIHYVDWDLMQYTSLVLEYLEKTYEIVESGQERVVTGLGIDYQQYLDSLQLIYNSGFMDQIVAELDNCVKTLKERVSRRRNVTLKIGRQLLERQLQAITNAAVICSTLLLNYYRQRERCPKCFIQLWQSFLKISFIVSWVSRWRT